MTKDCNCHSDQECECGHDCDCGSGGRFERQYMTRAEQTAELEAYLAELKLEVQAVEEHLEDLRKASAK